MNDRELNNIIANASAADPDVRAAFVQLLTERNKAQVELKGRPEAPQQVHSDRCIEAWRCGHPGWFCVCDSSALKAQSWSYTNEDGYIVVVVLDIFDSFRAYWHEPSGIVHEAGSFKTLNDAHQTLMNVIDMHAESAAA